MLRTTVLASALSLKPFRTLSSYGYSALSHFPGTKSLEFLFAILLRRIIRIGDSGDYNVKW